MKGFHIDPFRLLGDPWVDLTLILLVEGRMLFLQTQVLQTKLLCGLLYQLAQDHRQSNTYDQAWSSTLED
jgi:hypothetical protein